MDFSGGHTIGLRSTCICVSVSSDEEEEEEESDDDSQQEIPMDNEPMLVTDSLEPPAKLSRTDSRGVFVQAPPTN